MTKDDFEQTIGGDFEPRVHEGAKAILEDVLQEEMTEHLKAGFRELTPTRRGESATTTFSTTSSPRW